MECRQRNRASNAIVVKKNFVRTRLVITLGKFGETKNNYLKFKMQTMRTTTQKTHEGINAYES